jgi:hypothetical protein
MGHYPQGTPDVTASHLYPRNEHQHGQRNRTQCLCTLPWGKQVQTDQESGDGAQNQTHQQLQIDRRRLPNTDVNHPGILGRNSLHIFHNTVSLIFFVFTALA